MENYISYLINIVNYSLKKNLPIETCYSVLYSKFRKNEREATNLAGFYVKISFIFVGYTSSNGRLAYIQL